MSEPLVSVIIPCYNTAHYLPETLNSLKSQTFQDFEVIAIDDGSTDNTLEVLHQHAKHMPQLKIIGQKNTYYIQARINAIKHAKGKYLVCLDSDDVLAPDYLRVCVEAAEADSELSIVYTEAQFFDGKSGKWNLPEVHLPSFLLQNCIYVTALVRKSAYDAAGGFNPEMTALEDWDLFVGIVANGGKVKRIGRTLFHYRQRADQSSVLNQASQEKISDNMFRIYNRHYDFYKQNNLYIQTLMNGLAEKLRKDEIDLNNRKKQYRSRLKRYFYKLTNPKKYNEIQSYFD